MWQKRHEATIRQITPLWVYMAKWRLYVETTVPSLVCRIDMDWESFYVAEMA